MTDTIDAAQELRRIWQRYGWINRIRPQSLAEPLYRLLGAQRRITVWRGAHVFVDPFSHFGQCLARTGDYEAEQCVMFEKLLPRGGSLLDVGANEGVFSALAAGIIGSEGLIIAVEPQSRVCDIARINIALNHQGQADVIRACISQVNGGSVKISLGPTSNTGGSGIVNPYRWSTKTETVGTRSLDSIIEGSGRERIDLVKIDVEGYESEVILSGLRSIDAHKIRNLAVDYHHSILVRRGKSATETDVRIKAAGYEPLEGDAALGGYVIYRSPD